MIGSVSRAVERPQCRPLRLKDLRVNDVVLTKGGIVFVDFCVGAEGEEVFDAADVVAVPVGQEGVGDGCAFGCQERGEGMRPAGFAFPSVDEEAGGAGADEVVFVPGRV